MAKKSALGKGLGALLPDNRDEEETEDRFESLPPRRTTEAADRVRLLGRVAELDVDSIRPNPYQPRQDFDEAALDELAASIRQLGIIQPLTVRALGEGKFELIAGERRLRAARRAELSRVPAFVRDADSEAMLEMAIVENIQREDLNPVEEALGYLRLIEECELTQEQAAAKVGRSRSAVTNSLRLLKLPPPILASLRDGTLSSGHARMLVAVEGTESQLALHRQIIDKGLSVRQVEELIRRHRSRSQSDTTTADARKTAKESSRNDIQIKDFTNKLRDRLSAQVAIKIRENGAGKIEINYFSEEDLERLLDLLLER